MSLLLNSLLVISRRQCTMPFLYEFDTSTKTSYMMYIFTPVELLDLLGREKEQQIDLKLAPRRDLPVESMQVATLCVCK